MQAHEAISDQPKVKRSLKLPGYADNTFTGSKGASNTKKIADFFCRAK